MKEVTFFRDNGVVFSIARDIQAFSHLFHLGVYNFRIDNGTYSRDSWRGREVAEKLFGKSVTPFRSLFGSFPY